MIEQASSRDRLAVWPLYRAMVGVGLLCGLLIVGVFELTGPLIARNRAEALQEAILEVLPGAIASRSFRLAESGGFEALAPGEASGTDGGLVHTGFDAEGELVGVAIQATGMGYQDVIRVLYGYSIELDAIVGFRVLESRETPGLGDRIASDPGFLRNFERLEVPLDEGGVRPLHEIVAVLQGSKRDAWEVDGITGATISSEAVARLLDESVEFWVPLVERQVASLRAPDPPPLSGEAP